MDQISTTNKVLLKAYNELNFSDAVKMNSILAQNMELMDDFTQLKAMMGLLDSAYCEPHPTSVQIILEESMRAELETH